MRHYITDPDNDERPGDPQRTATAMTGCDCRSRDPLRGMTYAQASSTATRLYVQGWRQSRCKSCRLFTEWKRRGVRWAAETAAAGSP